MKNSFSLTLTPEARESKDAALWYIIRHARLALSKSDIPGEMKEFGDEMPLSTKQMQEELSMSRQNFCAHMKKYKAQSLEKFSRSIEPLFESSQWISIYSKSVFLDFVWYLRGKWLKYFNKK